MDVTRWGVLDLATDNGYNVGVSGEDQPTDLAVVAQKTLEGFFSPGDIGSAFTSNNWVVQQMVKTLTDIINDERTLLTKHGEKLAVTAKDKIAAMQMLQKLAKESMMVSGQIETLKAHAERQLSDGTKVTMDAEKLQKVREGSSRIQATMDILRRDQDAPSDNREQRRLLGSSSGPGDGNEPAVYDAEWTDATPAPPETSDNNQSPIGGSEDEREARVPQQLGRGSTGQAVGGDRKSDGRITGAIGGPGYPDADFRPPPPTSKRHPVVPGPRVPNRNAGSSPTLELLQRLVAEEDGAAERRDNSAAVDPSDEPTDDSPPVFG